MIAFDAISYTINDFWEWQNREELSLSPKFQRRLVWNPKAKSYLMDTIIRGLPIPIIFMQQDIDLKTRKSVREIVDGQQRIASILSFLNDGFKILNVHNKEFGGKYFTELPPEQQKSILNFKISVNVLRGATEEQILDIFARINTYTVTLNRQEQLNAKYFGAFKQTVYSLGYEFKQFFVNNNVITEREVTRMIEAEFASELIILLLDGIQSRRVIERYYREFDDIFAEEDQIRSIFRENIDIISQLLGDNFRESYFASIPLFYSLFAVIDELRREDILNIGNYPKISNILYSIDSILHEEPENINPEHFKFYDASTKHVTDVSSRQTRHDFIIGEIRKVFTI